MEKIFWLKFQRSSKKLLIGQMVVFFEVFGNSGISTLGIFCELNFSIACRWGGDGRQLLTHRSDILMVVVDLNGSGSGLLKCFRSR